MKIKIMRFSRIEADLKREGRKVSAFVFVQEK